MRARMVYPVSAVSLSRCCCMDECADLEKIRTDALQERATRITIHGIFRPPVVSMLDPRNFLQSTHLPSRDRS